MAQTSDSPKIGAPATRALQSIGITELKQLNKVRETELLQLHGFGPRALGILRETLQKRILSFAGSSNGKAETKKKAPPVSRIDKVHEFMESLDHPFKAEIQAVRDIIKGVNKGIVEEIKWKAPSFSYKEKYLVTFNLWDKERIRLVFHNPKIPALEKILKQLIKLTE